MIAQSERDQQALNCQCHAHASLCKLMMMMMINFIHVSRPHSLGKSHTNLGTQLIDIKNM